jgi:hypothetical protein
VAGSKTPSLPACLSCPPKKKDPSPDRHRERTRRGGDQRRSTAAVKSGKLRQDLYYCVNVVPLRNWRKRAPGVRPARSVRQYLYGYLNEVRHRKLNAGNVEGMWLLGRSQPSIASSGGCTAVVTEAVAELVDSVRSLGLLRGDAVALDGSKFRAVSSAKLVRGQDAVKHYVE